MNDRYQQSTQTIKQDHAEINITNDYYNGQRLDTHIKARLDLWIAGDTIDEFVKDLDELTKKYRI